MARQCVHSRRYQRNISIEPRVRVKMAKTTVRVVKAKDVVRVEIAQVQTLQELFK